MGLFLKINTISTYTMAKKVFFFYIVFNAVIIETHAISFVNNKTMPSDILTKIFFDEIKNKKNLINTFAIRSTENYDSEKCILGLQEIVNRFPSMDVLPFVDAWGKIPAGILYGHLQDLGNFDQCLETSSVLSELTGLVNGQYCFASIPLLQGEAPASHDTQLQRQALDLLKISIAVCVPDTCDPILLSIIFQEAADELLEGALSGITVDRCQTAKRPELEPINIVGIAIFSVFGAMMLLSTLYDVYCEYNRKKPGTPVLLAFSILTNVRKLLTINTSKSPNSIDCLLGIRVISTVWVVLCHNYSLTPMVPMLNALSFIQWFDYASSMHIIMGTVSVDSFLFMSGLLVAWLGLRELDKSNGRLNILMMYFHRYVRLTPPVAAVILFLVSINKLVGIGPYRHVAVEFLDTCKINWWSTLLYVQNYVVPTEVCVPQTWYLAVDTQLYVLSPLILIPLWKWGRKFVPFMITLSILSIGCIISTYLTEGYNQFIGVLEQNQTRLTYAPTHTRYTVWLIGIGLGYFMHRNKHNPFVPSKPLQAMGWIVCFTTILAIIYGPYFTMNADRPTTVFEAAAYESFKRVGWAFVLSWIIYACHFGFGGLINAFLSHPNWQPWARLTYSMYLVHIAVQSINYGTTRTDISFSDFNTIIAFWGAFGLSLTAALLLYLSFEAPILILESALLSRSKPKTIQQDAIVIVKSDYSGTLQKSV